MIIRITMVIRIAFDFYILLIDVTWIKWVMLPCGTEALEALVTTGSCDLRSQVRNLMKEFYQNTTPAYMSVHS